MTGFPPDKSNDRPYVCVDLSKTDTGDLDRVKGIIEHCANTGVDAVNLPLYRTNHLISLVHREEEAAEYRDREIDREAFASLEEHAQQHGLTLSATVYDPELLDWYDSTIEAPYVHFHGGDVTYRRLLEAAAEVEKTPLLSTAAADESEIERILEWVDRPEATLLHEPVGNSPNRARENWLAQTFDRNIGLKGAPEQIGHENPGNLTVWMPQLPADQAPETAVEQIEAGLENLVSTGESSDVRKNSDSDGPCLPTEETRTYRSRYRRSLMAAKSLSAGETLRLEMVREMRPYGGLPAESIGECDGIMVQRPTDPQEMIAY